MPVKKQKDTIKDGIYKDILNKTQYVEGCDKFSIDKQGFVVINENTDLEDSFVGIVLQNYRKLRIKPYYKAQPIIDYILKHGFPEYITHIQFDFSIWLTKWNVIFDKLPCGLKYLGIDSTNIEDASFDWDNDNVDSYQFNYSINNLPDTLEELYIYSATFNQPLVNLPSGLKVLFLNCYEFNQSIDNLPVRLETLIIEKGNGSLIRNIKLDNLPPNLKHLYILCDEIEYTKELLPPSLVRISLPDYQL